VTPAFTLKQAIDDLFDHRLAAEEALDRHFSGSFRQRVNGDWLDRSAFLAGIIRFREIVESATVTVLDEFVDGDRYAERHVVDLRKRDGSRIRQEVYVFARRDADSRFVCIEEMSLPLVWRQGTGKKVAGSNDAPASG
jgi:hypothetical protein